MTYMVISPSKSLYFRLKRNERFYVSHRHVASEFWGTGVFGDGARLTIGFAFETLGTHRLEARAALRKLGASREGILRKSFLRHGEHHDQGCGRSSPTSGGTRRAPAPHR
jgi:RimJ/RimL family protein N-acetyltransferase